MDSLHDVLMELQKKQLQQLSDWLTVTEECIQKMDTPCLVKNLDSFLQQMDEHKVFPPFSVLKMIGKKLLKICLGFQVPLLIGTVVVETPLWWLIQNLIYAEELIRDF